MNISEAPTVRVNGVEISPDDIHQETQYHPAESQRAALIDATENLVINELVRQRAIKDGLLSESSTINSELAHEFCLSIVNSGATNEKLDESSCRRFYDANRARFTSAPLLEIRHILFAAAADDLSTRASQREKAEATLADLQQNPARFAELASIHSDCPSKTEHGLLGQVSSGQLIPEFERQVFPAPVGLMSRPLETRYGYHIVEVLQRVDGQLLPFEAVQNRIEDYLSEQNTRYAIANLIQELISEAKIDGFRFDTADEALVQ